MVAAARMGGRSDSRPLHIVLADGDPASRERLQSGFAELSGVEVDAAVANGADAVIDAYRLRPDVVLLDLTISGMSAAETTRHILRAAPGTTVCLLAQSEGDPGISAALDAGARECVDKSLAPDAIAARLERIHQR